MEEKDQKLGAADAANCKEGSGEAMNDTLADGIPLFGDGPQVTIMRERIAAAIRLAVAQARAEALREAATWFSEHVGRIDHSGAEEAANDMLLILLGRKAVERP